MCFSPEASFAGGIIILAIGVATVTKVHKPSQIVFASIPLFFGVQQIIEGFLWLTLPHPEYLAVQKISTFIFLLTAEVLWPVIIPLSVLLMEENLKRKRVLRIFLLLGLSVAFYYGYCLLFYTVHPQIAGFHIRYYNEFPKPLAMAATVLYVFATIPPLFISSIKRTYMMGVLMALSFTVTAIFYTQYLTSVWCFFAALLSVVIFWILRDSKRKFRIGQVVLS